MSVSVYTATNLVNGKRYVGISKDPVARRRQHIWASKNRAHGAFHLALAKHGPVNFDWQVVAELPTLQEAQIAERLMIATTSPEYNLSQGGDGNWGYVPTAEARQKNGDAHRGMKRPPRTAEHKKALGQSKIGKPLSAELRAKLSKIHAGRPSPRKGVPLTAEHKENIRQAMLNPEVRAKLAYWKGKPNHPLKGRKLTTEHRAKLSAAAKKRHAKGQA